MTRPALLLLLGACLGAGAAATIGRTGNSTVCTSGAGLQCCVSGRVETITGMSVVVDEAKP